MYEFVFFLGGRAIGGAICSPNGTPKEKVVPPIIFKKYFGEILVRFMNMVYGIVFGFSETHLTFLERISQFSAME